MLKGGVNMNVAQQIQSLQDELEKNELNIETTMQALNKMKKENQQIKKIIKTLEKLQEDQ